MSEEIYDVVDERDQVVRQADRHEVHGGGLRHRAVHVLIYNQRGEVFLQKRSMKKDRYPGTWDSSASGHVDAGEDYDTCALRELKEELGYTPPEPLRRLFKINACPETDLEFIWIYTCQAEGPFTLAAEEIERGNWFSPQKVTQWLRDDPEDFAGGLRVIWSKMGEMRDTNLPNLPK